MAEESAISCNGSGARGGCGLSYRWINRWLRSTPPEQLLVKRREAEILFRRAGITFAVYTEGGDPERLIPFDLIPRVIAYAEWQRLEAGLMQRVRALNAFVHDVYHEREFVRAGHLSEHVLLQNSAFRPEMAGFDVPAGIYAHVVGVDIVCTGPGDYYVLEDNCRIPSGVSYVMENREAMQRLLPDLFRSSLVRPVEHYPDSLLATLRSVAPAHCNHDPLVVVLTPGIHNSAYYEHTFLADEMGVDLVEGDDLVVVDDICFERTTSGLRRVDVIYRRVDDEFLDPLLFRTDSLLGVPGLYSAYRAGNVTLANAVGGGIADDKAIYIHVPQMIRFYLGEEPLLKNIPTYDCSHADDLAYVLAHLDELVTKPIHGSGGHGVLVGPQASKAQIDERRAALKRAPGNYIAQPTLALSTEPTFVDSGVAPRHVDLRPFVLSGRNGISIVPGGLTRVALAEGSLVVNSSQGGGTKDTWVVNSNARAYR